MKLSKKQEKAIDTVLDALGVVLNSGLDSDEDGSIGDAIDELSKMRYKSIVTKEREKAKKQHLKNILEDSSTITLDAKWYDENIRSN